MLNSFIYIFVIGNFLGFILIGIAIWGFMNTFKEHKKKSNDDFILENEKKVQKKNIKILIIGLIVIWITIAIQIAFTFGLIVRVNNILSGT